MKVFIVAGEVSGDIHAAKFLMALKKLDPDLSTSGIGGDQMISAGLDARYHIKDMAFLGLGEIIRHLPFIRRVFKDTIAQVKHFNPDVVILVDYPGFNLRLAKKIKGMGYPIVYYISPQLWAWGKRRVKKIKAYIDRMLVLFPFEEDFYKKYNIPVTYVGHPLVDSHHNNVRPKKYGAENRILGLLPGSRNQELQKILPIMIQCGKILHEQKKIDEILIARVKNIPLDEYQKCIEGYDFFRIYDGPMDKFYNQLDVALVSSGTATLETAYFKVPMVIVYRVANLTWSLGKRLVKLDSVGLANIVAGKNVATELLQDDFTPENAANELDALLHPEMNLKKRVELEVVKNKLGSPGASQRAAKEIISFVAGKTNKK